MNINWYPGHMKKALDQMKSQLKLIDVIIELVDARIPMSSSNPILDEIGERKSRLLIFTKEDLADPEVTNLWKKLYRKEKVEFLFSDIRQPNNAKPIIKGIKNVAEEIVFSRKEKGIKSPKIKVMVIGVPNVGKSTLINLLRGKKSAKTGNKPGVTKGQQWIKIDQQIDLLDTPGVLWPKFKSEETGMHLAFTGAIKDDVLDIDTLGLKLIEVLMEKYPENLMKRYDIKELNNKTALETMEAIAMRRGFIMKGQIVDYTKTAEIVLDEFRKGKLGKISLERPVDFDG